MTTSRLSGSLSASPRQTAAITSATPGPRSSTSSGAPSGPSTRNSCTQTSSSSPVRRVESSSITRSPRSSSIGIASRELDLRALLVEAHAASARRAAAARRRAPRPPPGGRSRRCRARPSRPTCSPCSGSGSGAATPPPAAGRRPGPWRATQQVAQLVVPRARERDDLAPRARAAPARAARPARGRGSARASASLSSSTWWVSTFVVPKRRRNSPRTRSTSAAS